MRERLYGRLFLRMFCKVKLIYVKKKKDQIKDLFPLVMVSIDF